VPSLSLLSFLLFFFFRPPRPPRSTLFPYTTLFRSLPCSSAAACRAAPSWASSALFAETTDAPCSKAVAISDRAGSIPPMTSTTRSEEHTSELQSRENLVCRLLLEKKKKKHKE